MTNVQEARLIMAVREYEAARTGHYDRRKLAKTGERLLYLLRDIQEDEAVVVDGVAYSRSGLMSFGRHKVVNITVDV